MYRQNNTTLHELKNLIMADAVLVFAFSITFMHGIYGISSANHGLATALGLSASSSPLLMFLYIIPIMFVGVTLSFIFHELMHKYVAQHYGAIAGFRASSTGLVITLATSLFGFLIGIPGATIIYASSFTKRENGIVSIAGPLTNFIVFGIFLAIDIAFGAYLPSYFATLVTFTMFISILLAFFNMLPIYPLDGSKVLAWSKPVYFATLAVIFALMLITNMLPIYSIIFMILMALIFSFIYRGMFF
ncbi:MAG: site-2 protease family protein [Candidatus Micrarchaeaceae archaeon]